MFPGLRDLAYSDDETTIGRISQVLKLVTVSNPVFKADTSPPRNTVYVRCVVRTPKDRDEVNRRDVCKCDGDHVILTTEANTNRRYE
jgi:hypothetical protein